jgi:sulfide:quinone oxidoreductase
MKLSLSVKSDGERVKGKAVDLPVRLFFPTEGSSRKGILARGPGEISLILNLQKGENDMKSGSKPHVLILGGNFAGLTTARFIRDYCKDGVEITLIDRKPYLIFIPNIPIEVFANHDPAETLHMPIVRVLEQDGTRFIQAEVREIDIKGGRVAFSPTERPGAAEESIDFDYLVIALGARLAYDKIEGFGKYGYTLSDSYYGNKLRAYLHGGAYKGGPIAVGSARFNQGTKGKPGWLPLAEAACEGPPLEVALSLASWLQDHHLGGPKNITLFTPAKMIAEDAGEAIVNKFLEIAGGMGFGYKNNTRDIKTITEEGVQFANGESLEAELKIIFPNWEPHDFMKGLPVVDEVGFVMTNEVMRNPDYPNVFAAGDSAAITVPKLGALGHTESKIVAEQIAKDIGKVSAEEADKPFRPAVFCIGDMGHRKGFYIHSDTWYGGKLSVLKMGHIFYGMKLAFKEMYYRTGGKIPSWSIPLSELIADTLV